jgi:hypothetical protein
MRRVFQALFLLCLVLVVLPVKRANANPGNNDKKPLPTVRANYNWLLSDVIFLESEISRMYHVNIKLSSKFFVYWDLIEKVKKLDSVDKSRIQDTLLSQSNVMQIAAKHGLMTESSYSSPGLKISEILSIIKEIEKALSENDYKTYSFDKLKKVIDSSLGTPPYLFKINDSSYDALSLLNLKLKFIPTDYYHFVTDSSFGFYQKINTSSIKYPHIGKHGYNIPEDTLCVLMKDAIDKGYRMQLSLNYKNSDFTNTKFQKWYKRKYKTQNNNSTVSLVVYEYKIKNYKLWFHVQYLGLSDRSKFCKWSHWINRDEILLHAPSLLMYKYAASRVLDRIIK